MKRLQQISALLTLVLLAGQWLAIAHSAEHTAYQADDALCILCVQTHNLEQAQASHVPEAAVDTQLLAPSVDDRTAPAHTRTDSRNIRAPPFSVQN